MHRALLALAVLAATLGAPLAVPSAGAWTNGVCTTPDGVTVVIDFQELGGGVHVRCAPQPVTSGFSALQQAGIDYTTTVRFPGFICKIAGRPESDPCQTASPATAYWSYWLAARGGQWCYSNWGAGNRTPPAGSVEGWSFSLDKSASTSPAPRFAVPAPLPGTAPGGLPGNDCDPSATAPKPSGPAPTTPPAPAPTAPALPPPAAPPAAGVPDPATGGAPTDGSPVYDQHRDDAQGTVGEPGSSTTTTPTSADADEAGADAEVDAATDERDDSSTGDDDEELADGVVIEDDETAAVDLSGTGRDAGSPIGVIVTLALVAALGSGAFLLRRRAALRGRPAAVTDGPDGTGDLT